MINIDFEALADAIVERLHATLAQPAPVQEPQDPAEQPEPQEPATPEQPAPTGSNNIRTGMSHVQVDDWADLQGVLDTCDYNSPRVVVMPNGASPIDMPPLIFPPSPHTQLIGRGMRFTEIQPKAGQPAIVFAHDNVHSNHIADFTIHYNEQSTGAPAFQYGLDRPDEMGCYHQIFERIQIDNPGSAWGMVRGHGKQTMWNQMIRDCYVYGFAHSVFDMDPSESIGMPIIKVDRLTAINTGLGWSRKTQNVIPRTVNDAPVFKLNAAEFHLTGLDLEGCYGEMVRCYGGGNASFRQLHIEHHRLNGAGEFGKCFATLQNGPVSMHDFSIAGGYEDGYRPASFVSVDHGAAFTYSNGQTAWGDGPDAVPFVKAYTARPEMGRAIFELSPVMRPFGGGLDGTIEHR